MRQVKHNWHYSFLCVLLLACCPHAFAQNISFVAKTSTNKVGVKDQLQVNYTITNAKLKSISRPNFSDFDLLGGPYQSSSSQFIMSGNTTEQTSSVTVSYIVRPKHTGNLVIPPLQATDANGHSYQSNAITIQVVPGSIAMQQPRQRDPYDDPNYDPFAAMVMRQRQMLQQQLQQQQQYQQPQMDPADEQKTVSKDLFIKVTVDKSKVHVGEQVTASYKLYSCIPMQVGISKLPSLNGFWTQDFEIPKVPKPTEEIINGKKYQVFLLKKSALFPQQTGTLELDPAEADGVARIIQRIRERNPLADMLDDPRFQGMGSLLMSDPFFNNGFFNSMAYRDVQVHLKSTPVKITVTPLPEKDKPADFSGAVGNFSISGNISKQNFTTDDAVTYTIKITGSGNLKLIEAPKLNLPNGLDTYDPVIVDTITGRSTTISGSKIITYTITPHTPGDYTIPSVPFSYYNPQSGNYVSTTTVPLKIHVSQGKHYTPSNNSTSIALKDIHDITTQPLKKLSYNSKPLLLSPVYWSMYALPFFAFIGIIVWKRREEELAQNTVLLRNRRANKIALKRLTTAQKLLQQNAQKPFYEEVSKAIWLYLSDKLNIPLSSLSRESAEIALSKHNVPDSLRLKMEHVITECETSLYAQTGGSKQMQQTYREAIDVISKLEEIF